MKRPASSQPTRRTPSRGRRGVTLIELVIGVLIATFLTAAAVAFAAHETRLMGISRDKLDMSQSSRASLDLLVSDLAMAGGGLGYDAAGTFRGVDIGRFGYGACGFNSTGAEIGYNPAQPVAAGAHELINLRTVGPQGTRPAAYQMRTMDLLTIYADGSYASIATETAGLRQFCANPGTAFGPNELGVMATADGLAATAISIQTNNAIVPCAGNAQCLNGCVNFTFVAAPNYQSQVGAVALRYVGGELRGGLKNVIWFVASDGQDGTLRRHVFDTSNLNCAGRNNNLGGAVANNVESMQFQLYQFITDPGLEPVPRWVNMGQSQLNGQRFKTRMDVEIVMRSRTSSDNLKRPAQLRLQTNLCVPNTGPCNVPQDAGERDVFRTSVEIKNAGI